MSKLTDLPKRVLDTIIKTEKKLVMYPVEEKYKRIKEKFQDLKENRELIVVDKFGNRYYQYYSYHGLPTRRVVINNLKGFNQWDDDPLMSSWLQRRRLNPPSQEELEKMYIEQEEFQRRGLEWDRKEQAMIDAWKKQKQEAIDKERKETKAIGEGENFQPGAWDRKTIANPESNNISLDFPSNSLVPKNELMEVPEEKKELEGMSDLPGKYIMDFREEDEKWMERRRLRDLAPYIEMTKKIDWSEYTFEKMVERASINAQTKRDEIENQKQQLTNIGKKMIEKKQAYSTYSNFREKFKDVFSDHKF